MAVTNNITDPTELFSQLTRCIDEESGKPTDLPSASTKAIIELLEDDQPNETDEIRGMNALAARRLWELKEIVEHGWEILLLMARTDEKLNKKLMTLAAAGGDPRD